MLLERDSELRILDDVLAGLEESGGKVVLVRGEAGIGKSSLVREFVDAHGDDSHICFGSCDDLLTPQPLGPLRDIAQNESSLAGALETDDRPAVLATSLDLLSVSLRSNIMVFEDTHWADEATLDVIKYLGRRIARTNGLLLLTYRDGEVDYDHPLRQVIGELAPETLVRIHLAPLSKFAIAKLVGSTDLDIEEVQALTDGNPLFVTELLTSGVDEVPVSVQDSVLARAAKLSSGARAVLDLVSVLPRKSERSLIENILGPNPMDITECVRQGLLNVGDQAVSFHHELTRRSVESALNPADRQRWNAEVLAELGEEGELALLVHHAREADDVKSIIKYAPKAARAAMAVESHREAVAHFRVLEPFLDQIKKAERAGIVYDWARAEYFLIGSESLDILDHAIDLYRSTGDDLALARTLIFAVRVNEISGRPDAAETASLEAIQLLEAHPPGADLASALAQRAWILKMRGEGALGIATADQALELAETMGDELSVVYALDTKGVLTHRLGDPEGFRLMDESRRRAEQAGYPFEETLALLNMAEEAAEQRDLERAADLAQRARDTAVRNEIRIHGNAASAHYARILDWRGQWIAAEEMASESVGGVTFYSELVAGQVLGPLQVRLGRPEARTTIENTWARAEAGNEMQSLLPAAAAVAEFMWLTGDGNSIQITRFLELLDDERRLAFPWSSGWLASWLWILGEPLDVPDGVAEPYRLLMDGESAAAAAFWKQKGIPYERGLALMHGSGGDRLEALEIFETLGATPVASKLRKQLRDEGVSVPRGKGRDTRTHAAGLTARQAEVLQLLGEGLTNIEIADRLFVSPRTVENHVSAVLTKLGSSTREEAVSRALNEGILPALA